MHIILLAFSLLPDLVVGSGSYHGVCLMFPFRFTHFGNYKFCVANEHISGNFTKNLFTTSYSHSNEASSSPEIIAIDIISQSYFLPWVDIIFFDF
jgi:hypothetical protein